MKKPTVSPRNFLYVGLFLLLCIIWFLFDLPCIYRFLFGIPCPGCGMTRAWLAAFRLDLGGAFRQHPMFWSVPILFVFAIFDGKLFPHRKLNYCVIGSLLAGIFFVYLARLFGFLGGLSPL